MAASELVKVRPAHAGDVQDIFNTIGYWAGQGKMLVRPMHNIFENLRDFFVAEVDGTFAGCGALHILWGDIAEVRGLTPLTGWRGLPRGDLAALARAVAAVSRLAARADIAEAEINPLIIHAEGDGVTVADAWVVRA